MAAYKAYAVVTTLEDCKQNCLDRTDFVCRTLNFRASITYCYMREDNSTSAAYAAGYTYPCSSGTSSGYVYLERTPVTDCEHFAMQLRVKL